MPFEPSEPVHRTLPEDAIVKIELDNRPYEVRLAAVDHLFADICKYNDQFSLGSMMVRALFAHFKVEDDEEGQAKMTSLGGEEEHQKMTASALAVIHEDTLNKLGLSLEPVSGKRATMIGLGETAGIGEMRINITNKNNFVAFLGALEPEQIEDTGLKVNLENLSGLLANQVLDNYNLKEPSDEMLQLFGGLGNIVNQYKRLGMGEAVKGLKTYLQHSRQGDLREFVAIESNRLMSEPRKNFGPADWQRDATVEYLQDHWEEALTILKMAKDNPKARELYEKLGEHLLKCIKIARAETEAFTEGYYTADARKEMKHVLRDVEEELEKITSKE